MDLFMEHLVQHKRTGKDLFILIGIIAGAGILMALSLLLLLFPATAGMWLLIEAAIIFFAVLLIKRTSVEYEYILTNNELDIDKILAKSNRKRLITINFGDIEICAPVSHNAFKSTQGIARTLDCTGNGTAGVYFIDLATEKGKTRVLIEPPVSYIENVRRYNPSKIFVD